METFVLIAFIWTGASGIGFTQVRTPDLPELQCKLMKMQINGTRWQTAWCAIQGRPEPVWSPSRTSPTRECASCDMDPTPGRRPA